MIGTAPEKYFVVYVSGKNLYFLATLEGPIQTFLA